MVAPPKHIAYVTSPASPTMLLLATNVSNADRVSVLQLLSTTTTTTSSSSSSSSSRDHGDDKDEEEEEDDDDVVVDSSLQ